MKKSNTTLSRATIKHITEGVAFLKSDASDRQMKKKAINHNREQIYRLSTELNLKVPSTISISVLREERDIKVKSLLLNRMPENHGKQRPATTRNVMKIEF